MSVDSMLNQMEQRNLKSKGINFDDDGCGCLIFIMLILVISFFGAHPNSPAANLLQIIPRFYSNVVSVIGSVQAAIAFGIMALPLGYAFFKIREKRRLLYGYLEIGFGIFSAIFTVGDKNNWEPLGNVGNTNLITFGVFFASIYIIVRGFDNLQQGKKQIAEYLRLLNSSEQNQIETVKYLLESGIDVNHQSSEGITALMLAVNKGNIEIVRLLLEKGANKLIVNKHGTTALDLAKKNNHTELVKLLSQKS